jgi:hypothetical protein
MDEGKCRLIDQSSVEGLVALSIQSNETLLLHGLALDGKLLASNASRLYIEHRDTRVSCRADHEGVLADFSHA